MTLPWPRGSRKKKVRIYHPENKLRALVNRPGGISRDIAIASAERCIEELREPTLDVIAASIAEFSEIVNQGVTPANTNDILRLLDGIITLSATFGQRPLVLAAMNLVDLLKALLERDCIIMEPIIVHAEAIKLLSPRSEPLSEIGVAGVLEGLDEVLRHFDVKIPPDRLASLPV